MLKTAESKPEYFSFNRMFMKTTSRQLPVILVLFFAFLISSCLKEPELDDCYCQNGGVCIGSNCSCPPGYSGVYCETFTGNSCSFTQQSLSESRIRTALQNFTYDGTAITQVAEARKMLQHLCSTVNIHTSDSDHACGRFPNGWHITIWRNTYGKANTYGIRFNLSDNHTHYGNNNTYFEIVKGGGSNGTPTHTAPSTLFEGVTNYTLQQQGSWYVQPFSISSAKNFVLRFASTYSATCAIITPDQETSFKNGGMFQGYGLFDKQFGYKPVTLPPGNYLLAVRNHVAAANPFTVELDYAITLPASDKCSYFDTYIYDTRIVGAKQYYYREFQVQQGYRYFVDGCNSGMYVFFLPENQLTGFLNGQNFQHYTQYSSTNIGADPGLYEIDLPPGKYYLAAYNFNNNSQTLVYDMQRWKQN